MDHGVTRSLLFLIALALWGLLLRPLTAPTSAHAGPAAGPSPVPPAIALHNDHLFIVDAVSITVMRVHGQGKLQFVGKTKRP